MANTAKISPHLKRGACSSRCLFSTLTRCSSRQLASNFTHQILPASLTMPNRDREEFTHHVSVITSIFTMFAMVPQQIFKDQEKNAAVIYAKMVGDLVGGLGDWTNECFMVLQMTEENGEVKIESIKEFVGSARAKFLPDQLKWLK
ncbi:hypothetical protein B0J14DRAFT_258829 [Halenospora varia]|nr:hypothetical protein B0J14DRAFT_258829 [Halenospora varia]